MEDSLDKLDDLWHYTTWETCRKILSPGAGQPVQLRASNLAYMNDSTELKLAATKVFEMCGPGRRRGLERPFWYVDTYSEGYAICFSRVNDSLSQWRAYGNTGGLQVAIGFGFPPILRTQPKRLIMQSEVCHGKSQEV